MLWAAPAAFWSQLYGDEANVFCFYRYFDLSQQEVFDEYVQQIYIHSERNISKNIQLEADIPGTECRNQFTVFSEAILRLPPYNSRCHAL